jgi:hypothetical protein
MSKRLARVKKDNPDIAEREDVRVIAADADMYAALDAFGTSEAGSIIRKSLLRDVSSTIDAIAQGWRTLPHAELMALAARLEERLALTQTFARARTNLELAEDALKEITG